MQRQQMTTRQKLSKKFSINVCAASSFRTQTSLTGSRCQAPAAAAADTADTRQSKATPRTTYSSHSPKELLRTANGDLIKIVLTA